MSRRPTIPLGRLPLAALGAPWGWPAGAAADARAAAYGTLALTYTDSSERPPFFLATT